MNSITFKIQEAKVARAFIIDKLDSFGLSCYQRDQCVRKFSDSAGVRESNKGRRVPKMSNELCSVSASAI